MTREIDKNDVDISQLFKWKIRVNLLVVNAKEEDLTHRLKLQSFPMVERD